MLIPLVALLAACGAPADAPSDSSGVLPAAAEPTLVDAPELVAAPALHPEPAVVVAPAAAPKAAPVVAPAAPAAPTPVVLAPAPDPAPTLDEPLIIDCVDDGCVACTEQLRADHREWYDTGVASCQKRTCAETAECSDLGADLVCAPFGTEPTDVKVCRAPRVALGHVCPVNEVRSTDGHDPVCEVGLWCVPVGNILHLICQPFDR